MTGPRSEPPMPMLTTFLIALPVWPFHSPERTRVAKALIWSNTAWTSATTSTPSTTQRRGLGHSQRDVEDRPILRDVDVLAPEHLVPALAEAGLVGQIDEQSERLVGDALLRIVEVDSLGLGAQALAAPRVLGEESSQVRGANGVGVVLRAPTRRVVGEGGERSWESPRW